MTETKNCKNCRL